jgi:hypothetical protein
MVTTADAASFEEEIPKGSEFTCFLIDLGLMPDGVVDLLLGDEAVAESDPNEEAVGFSKDGEGLGSKQHLELPGGNPFEMEQSITQGGISPPGSLLLLEGNRFFDLFLGHHPMLQRQSGEYSVLLDGRKGIRMLPVVPVALVHGDCSSPLQK